MALSSLSVVASSLALHLYRPPKVMSSQQISQQATSSNGRNETDDDLELHAPLLHAE
jgi:hypothetical protein